MIGTVGTLLPAHGTQAALGLCAGLPVALLLTLLPMRRGRLRELLALLVVPLVALPVVAADQLEIGTALPGGRLRLLVGLVALAPLCWWVDGRLEGTGALLLLVSAGGVYACAPDTEHVVLAGLALAAPALPGLVLRMQAPLACWAAWLALYAWGAAIGARGRPAAGFGAVGSLGLLVALGVSLQVVHRSRRFGPLGQVGVVAAHAGVALTAARLGPLRSDGVVAAAHVSVLLAVATAGCAGAVLATRRRPAPPEAALVGS